MGTVSYDFDLTRVDWAALKTVLAADDFDNGRSPEQLKRSFESSAYSIIAYSADGRAIGTARVLSDGVCNAYLVDVWTLGEFRLQGIARTMIAALAERLPGQHIYLQADPDNVEFYRRLGFQEQPTGLSRIVGTWLVNG